MRREESTRVRSQAPCYCFHLARARDFLQLLLQCRRRDSSRKSFSRASSRPRSTLLELVCLTQRRGPGLDAAHTPLSLRQDFTLRIQGNPCRCLSFPSSVLCCFLVVLGSESREGPWNKRDEIEF